jgi:hypothetical protein
MGDGEQKPKFCCSSVRRLVDFSAILIACLWGGLFLLMWPRVRQENSPHYQYKSMIVADNRKLPACELYRRPDIIALPSAVSFEPLAEENDYIAVLPEERDRSFAALERRDIECCQPAAMPAVALAAEAVTHIRGVDTFDYQPPVDLQPRGSTAPVFVSVSKKIGNGVEIKWSKSDYDKLFRGRLPWEAEVSLIIADDGWPQDVFLERPSGNAIVDRELVRTLSRPDVWQGASAGFGSVLVSFSPPLVASD